MASHTTASHATNDPNANRTRWGGILTLAAVLLIGTRVTLGLALMPEGLPAADAEAASFITGNAAMYTAISWIGVAGALCACVGAFFLVTRSTSTPKAFPASAFWLVTGVGQLLALGLWGFRGSGFVTLAENQAALPIAFEAARATFGVLGPVATAAIYAGLFAVFAGEARSRTAAAPAWLCWGVGVLALGGVALAAVNLFLDPGPAGMWIGVGITYGVLLGTLLWSLKVGWPHVSMAWSRAPARADEHA